MASFFLPRNFYNSFNEINLRRYVYENFKESIKRIWYIPSYLLERSRFNGFRKFVAKKPEKDFYRHIYVNIEDNAGIEHITSDGGYLSKNLKIDEICDKAETMIDGFVDFKRFYISATIKTPLFKS